MNDFHQLLDPASAKRVNVRVNLKLSDPADAGPSFFGVLLYSACWPRVLGDFTILPVCIQIQSVSITTSIRSYLEKKRSRARAAFSSPTHPGAKNKRQTKFLGGLQQVPHRAHIPPGCISTDVLSEPTHPPVGGDLAKRSSRNKRRAARCLAGGLLSAAADWSCALGDASNTVALQEKKNIRNSSWARQTASPQTKENHIKQNHNFPRNQNEICSNAISLKTM